MHLSTLRSVLLAAVAAQAANAHTVMTNFFVDDAPQGDGTCVRMSHNIEQATFPIRPIGMITGSNMACGKCFTHLKEYAVAIPKAVASSR